jgi:hypothetical protein
MEVDLDKRDFMKEMLEGGDRGCVCEHCITGIGIDDFQMILFENAIVSNASMRMEEILTGHRRSLSDTSRCDTP